MVATIKKNRDWTWAYFKNEENTGNPSQYKGFQEATQQIDLLIFTRVFTDVYDLFKDNKNMEAVELVLGQRDIGRFYNGRRI